jgi:hypothetical protein
VTFVEISIVRSIVNPATLEDVSTLDFKTPYEELSELRRVLTTQQIADLTGLRRETISRARPDSRFRRRTEKALGDLYLVVARMKSVLGDDLGQLAAVLRRPQKYLAGRSIADLLREGRADEVLEHLPAPEPSEDEQLENLRLPPDIEAQLMALEERPSENPEPPGSTPDERVATLLAADPELDSRLNAIEAAILAHFGREARIERQFVEREVPEGRDELHLRVYTELPLDEEIDRLEEFLDQERDLLIPVRRQLVIGFVG